MTEYRHRLQFRQLWIALAATALAGGVGIGVLRLQGGGHRVPSPPSSASSSSVPEVRPGASAHATRSAPIFAIYYMWWDRQHWLSRLGPRYPTAAGKLPAILNASGCGTVSPFAGNKETDISPGLAYDQAKPETIRRDVKLAAESGLAGFIVNWVGTGGAQQVPTSSDYNKRLGYLFDAVHQLQASGTRFSVILNYQSSAKRLPLTQFTNDFSYFLSEYGSDPALDHTYSVRPEVLMAGTWKYSDEDLRVISTRFRSRLYLIGDEKPASWDQARADYLDGSSYYWSSQDPLKNRSSFATLTRFAAMVRRTPNPDGKPKTWLAPSTPGYNAMLLYNTPTCVPRNDGQTMRDLFAGNSRSRPDGWTFISWNEISEGTYVVPLSRYGMAYVQALKSIATANR